MILRRLRASNASPEDIKKAEDAVAMDEQREKEQKARETAARKAKNDKKKEKVLQDIKNELMTVLEKNGMQKRHPSTNHGKRYRKVASHGTRCML